MDNTSGVRHTYAAMVVPHTAGGYLCIVRGADTIDIVHRQRHMTLAGGGAVLLVMVMPLALIQMAPRRMAMPRIDTSIDAVRHYAAGDSSTRIVRHGASRDEFLLLERTFNKTCAAIQRHDATTHRLTKHFQRVTRAANDWILGWDIATGESWVNASLHRLLDSGALLDSGDDDGVGEGISRTLTFQQFVHPDDIDAFTREPRAILSPSRDSWQHVCRVIDANRATCAVEIRTSPYRSQDGRAVRMAGGVIDISRRSTIEQKPRSSEANLRVAE